MVPIKYKVVGQEEYMLDIQIEADGEFTFNSGTYASEEPRKGKLTDEQETNILNAVKALGLPIEHPMPAGADAFEARLTVGEDGSEVTYIFWEGALQEDEKLNTVIRLLELL